MIKELYCMVEDKDKENELFCAGEYARSTLEEYNI